MGIQSFRDRFPTASLREHAAAFPSSVGDRTLPAEGVALDAAPIPARINAGRWIADCPQPGCYGAELVDLQEPLFFCCECRNASHAWHPIAVTVPEDREAIEDALTVRLVPATRNWHPGETVAELFAENTDHGVS